MINTFINFRIFLEEKKYRIRNPKLNQFLHEHEFIYNHEKISFPSHLKIFEKMDQSKVVVIDQLEEFFIVCFKKILILINKDNLHFLNPLFIRNSSIIFRFLSHPDPIYIEKTEIKNDQIDTSNDTDFKNEIYQFNKIFTFDHIIDQSFQKIWRVVQSCISGYLIMQSYEISVKNRLKNLENKQDSTSIQPISQNEYVEIRNIGSSSLSSVSLIYHIEKEELFALKKFFKSTENEKLFKRECHNYSYLNFPFIPKFIGETNEKDGIIIEFINGKILSRAKNLEFGDKLSIICELLVTVMYLHKNKFIYRDLKPNNIMIDHNNDIVLIDFDRMIHLPNISEDEPTTNDFTEYSDPLITTDELSYKNDIYSLGKIISYLIKNDLETELMNKEENFKLKINEIIRKCTSLKEQRPTINDLFYEFFNSIDMFSIINKDKLIDYLLLAANLNDVKSQCKLGCIYDSGQYIARNIDKAIHFFTLSANKNNAISLHNLGVIYLKGEDIPKNIQKAIHYFSLASDQNFTSSQLQLAAIYLENDDVQHDINKGIHYLSLAADYGNKEAQFILGNFYYKNKYVQFDINKAIHYFSLASDQNHMIAQFDLGMIYCDGKYVPVNIEKAIHYFTLASNQNDGISQTNLGSIYYFGEYVPRDINKAIHYYELAVNNNDKDAMYNLGFIYYEGKYVEHNINKAIHYYELAADKNDIRAQFDLGQIFFENKLVPCDINKAIKYLTLAANQNHAQSQFALAYIFFEVQFVGHDIAKAIHYLTLAANQNHKQAQYNLGVSYLG